MPHLMAVPESSLQLRVFRRMFCRVSANRIKGRNLGRRSTMKDADTLIFVTWEPSTIPL